MLLLLLVAITINIVENDVYCMSHYQGTKSHYEHI